MALEAAFECLNDQLRLLKEAVDELQLNVSGDYHPESSSRRRINAAIAREQAPLPVESLADKVSELEGIIEEARLSVASACQAVRHPRNLEGAQIALIGIQRCLNSFLKTFLFEVAAYDTIETLVRMGRRQGGKWPQWISLLKTVIEACFEPLHGSVLAISVCWEELTEKLNAIAISLKTTNVAQLITTREHPETAMHEFT